MKYTISDHHTSTRISIIKMSTTDKFWEDRGEKGVLLHSVLEWIFELLWKQYGGSLKINLFRLPWWLRDKNHLPMQETWVQSLVLEDTTCQGKQSPWAITIEPVLWCPGTARLSMRSAAAGAHMPHSPRSGTREATEVRGPHTQLESSLCALQLHKGSRNNGDPAQQKIHTVI